MRTTLICLLLIGSTAAFAAETPRIGKITIHALDVYADEEAERGRVYRVANALHPETRDSVIRKFLLFEEGDDYRPERLAESERNLRKLGFLKSASVVASEPHDGVVDVTVTTQDAWSIAPETQAGNKGGETTYGMSLTDSNVIGHGKEMSVSWNKGIDRTRFGLDYRDPAFNSAMWNTHIAYGNNSDGYDRRLQFRRPFFSFATPWAADISFQGFRQTDKLYEDGFVSSSFEQKHDEAVLAYGRAIDISDIRANRLTAGLHLTDDEYATVATHPDEVLPERRTFRYVFVRLEHAQNDFLKLNFVNKDIRFEDFDLGAQYGVELGVSPKAFGVDATTAFASLSVSNGWRLGDRSFVMPSFSIESRFDGGPQNAIGESAISFVRRGGNVHPQATVARVAYISGWRTDPEVQFFADGLTGLRAYRVHSFAGTRAYVMNLEQRFYLGRELLQLFTPGAVAFIDAGNAADPGNGNLRTIYTDVGVGIRIGLPRTPKNLLRIDFGYALRSDPLGHKGLMVTVSSGQAF